MRVTLKIEYQATTLSEYTLRASADHKHIRTVKNARRIETHFVSPQLHLWQTSETQWLLAIPQAVRQKRKIKRLPSDIVQLRFPHAEELWEDQA